MSSVSNAFYAQSGGVTAVINASACGLFSELKKIKKLIKFMLEKMELSVL